MMLFRTTLLLAVVTLAIARPNPSSVKTIASSSGSKSSIKSPSQKLQEKNSSPSVASIVELPLQSISQTENTNAGLASPQSQDSDSLLQYSSNRDLLNQPSEVVPTIVKEIKKEEVASSVIQNEVIKPSTYSNNPLPILDNSHVVVPIESVQHTPASTPVIQGNLAVVKEAETPAVVPSSELAAPVKPVETVAVPVVTIPESSIASAQPVVQSEVVSSPVQELKPIVVAEVPVIVPVSEVSNQPPAVLEVVKPVETPVDVHTVNNVVQPAAVAPVPIVSSELHNSPSVPIEVVNKEIVNSPVVASPTIVETPVNTVPLVSEVKESQSVPLVENKPELVATVVGVQPLAVVNPATTV